MTSTLKDAVRLLEMLVSECATSGAKGEHVWRKCPRCLASARVQDHDPLAEHLIKTAIAELKKR